MSFLQVIDGAQALFLGAQPPTGAAKQTLPDGLISAMTWLIFMFISKSVGKRVKPKAGSNFSKIADWAVDLITITAALQVVLAIISAPILQIILRLITKLTNANIGTGVIGGAVGVLLLILAGKQLFKFAKYEDNAGAMGGGEGEKAVIAWRPLLFGALLFAAGASLVPIINSQVIPFINNNIATPGGAWMAGVLGGIWDFNGT